MLPSLSPAGKLAHLRRSKSAADGLSAFCWRYGLGHYGKGLFWHSSELLFAFFLTEQAGLPAIWMGGVLIAGILSSAGIDLVVGRALRRRAFTLERALQLHLIGAWASALPLIALFATDLLPQSARIPYALAAALAYRIAYAFYDIPQNALVVLAAPDADTRARLSSLRLAFSGLAAITVATILTAMLYDAQEPRAGHFAIAAFAMSIVAIGTAWRVARGHGPTGAQDAPATMASRRFHPPRCNIKSLETAGLLTTMAFASFAISLFTTLEPYYAAATASGAPARLIVLAAAMGLTGSQILWLALVRHRSAETVLTAASITMGSAIWLFGGADPGYFGQIAMACLFGIANGGVGMALWTIYANSVSGRSAAGDPFAFALFTCAAKLGIAAAGGSVAYIMFLREGSDGAERLILLGMTWPPIAALGLALLSFYSTNHMGISQFSPLSRRDRLTRGAPDTKGVSSANDPCQTSDTGSPTQGKGGSPDRSPTHEQDILRHGA